MKNSATIYIWLCLLLCSWSYRTAALGITATTTATSCYNDGTITVHGSGGTMPYTFSIISGPSIPNLVYPIPLASGSTFNNLPQGTYSVKITDATGQTSTTTAVIGGSYQFPVCTVAQQALTLVCTPILSTGRAPYTYAISAAGPNSGFGAYQSSTVFSNICPGTYWIREQDACGNIYTTSIYFNYTLSAQILCISFAKGTLTATASGGHAPYTYSIAGQSNHTGIFTGLPSSFSALVVTDSCGVRLSMPLHPAIAGFNIHCPFDDNIYLSTYNPATGITQPGNLTYICTNCTPPQTITNPSTFVFHNISLGQTYDIEVASTACGGDTIHSTFTASFPPGRIAISYISCKGFSAKLYNSAGALVPNSAIDSFVLRTNPAMAFVAKNTTGIFNDLPAGSYYVAAYSASSCIGSTHNYITLPQLPSSCSIMMRDASCQDSWEFQLDSLSPDDYSLVYAPGDTVSGYRSFSAPNPVINFYKVNPGTYTLLSDSGCSWSLNFDSLPHHAAIAYSSATCGGLPSLYLLDTPQVFCNSILAKLYYGDSLISTYSFSTSSPIQLTVSDSGWYYYKFYALSYAGDSSAVSYDTICPIDTGALYVGYGSLPYPYSATLFSCGRTVAPQYYIFGGQVPYTVEIPGFDTVVLHSNAGTFPTDSPGVYTVIAYDNCGISHSFTFTIVDTCAPVTCATLVAGDDTAVCLGQSVLLTSIASISGGSYSWSPGTGSAQDTFVTPGYTTSYVVGYRQRRCPLIYDTITVTVVQPPTLSLRDTAICIGRSATLSTEVTPSGGTYTWSPGGYNTPAITVGPQASASYTVVYDIGVCPAVTDSARVDVLDTPLIAVHTEPALCTTADGRAEVLVSGGSTPYTYQWSDPTGSEADSISGLPAGGIYDVTVTDQAHCTASGSCLIADSIVPLDIFLVSLSDVTCYGLHDGQLSVHVSSEIPYTYQWDPAAGDSVLTALAAGVYAVTVTDFFGCADTASYIIHQPPLVSLAILPADSSIAENDSLVFQTILSPVPSGGISYDWQPPQGLSCSDCPYPVFSAPLGSYSYTLLIHYHGYCTVTDSIMVKVYSAHHVYIPNVFTPDGDGVNDTYLVFPVGSIYFDLKIFDRWGEMVFESNDPGQGWDGTYLNSKEVPGIYTYVLEVTFDDGYTAHNKGSLTLIR